VLVTTTALGAGVLTWAVFLMLGIRARHRAWLVWSAVYAALTVAFAILEALPDPGGTAAEIAVIPLIFTWFGGIAHVTVISQDATRRIWRANDPSLLAARERIERRAEGRRLAAQDPMLARELGVGRPDVPGADDYGLVDVNHAAPDALCQLPGITPQIAARIAQARQSALSFISADDLCVTLDLPPGLTDDLREHAIFL
jgi:DNA uptake protein ComE-like DNA-binding protein